ncbi:MAG: hypothetical protein OJF47_000547 [Nitrospira sp.]|jgi:hypothetical protein|nr:MAG: hypothetical protein OJF47_000547 [Nitrospira sp.]
MADQTAPIMNPAVQPPNAASQSFAPFARPDPLLLDLNPAVMEIRQACDELGAEAHRSPFFFVVGAGISYPPVPLAASIIGYCQGIAKRYNRVEQPDGQQTLDHYSHWFSRAYPGARQRQQYLRSLIENKPLSLSSLRLAHLLSARKLTNLVVTTNFDDFIARALRLFGEEPAVCDHPRTVGRIDRERADIQIVHVHGSYLFYDCANLRGEVTGRARADEETSFTMVGLLDSLLWNRSPLVIGYSGWEGDVIMSALKRRLRGGNPLAQSVYWFCYRRTDRETLPPWLRDSPDVRFVVPTESVPEPIAAVRAGVEDRAERRQDPTLPAFAVFDQLNRQFDIGKPALFDNPIEYFAKNLQTALPETEGPAGDPYGFKALIELLHRASRDFVKVTRATGGMAADLDRLRTLMRESQYPEAVSLLEKLVPARLSKFTLDERGEVLHAANLAGSALFAKPQNGKRAEALANLLVFDPQLDRMIGEPAKGTTLVIGSRTGQLGFETMMAGKPHGAFTVRFADTLRDPAADADGDGRISLVEATVAAGRRVLREGNPQTPVVAGDAETTSLFASGRRTGSERAQGTLHALLVGVGKHRRLNMDLNGPVNDIARLAQVLNTRERRLFQQASLRTLLDKEATRSRLDRALAALAASAKPQDLVLFYFSGHGSRRDLPKKAEGGQELFLVLYDFDTKGGGEITHRDILKILETTKAGRRVVILDF